MSQCYVCLTPNCSNKYGGITLCRSCGPKDPPKPAPIAQAAAAVEKEFGKGSVLTQKNGRPVDLDLPAIGDLTKIICAESDELNKTHCGKNIRVGVDAESWTDCTCAQCAVTACKWDSERYLPEVLYWPDTGYPVTKKKLKEWVNSQKNNP